MKYQHEFSSWLAIAVLIVGIGSIVLINGVTMPWNGSVMATAATTVDAVPTQPRTGLTGFNAATGDLPTMVPLSQITLVPTVPPTPPRPTSTAVPSLELPNVPVPDGGEIYLLTPATDTAVGWSKAADEVANHFGDFNIFAGTFGGEPHVGAMQFDLSSVPVGVPILYADLTLTGLANQWLGSDGNWSVQLLAEWMDRDWTARNFHWLSRADNNLTTLDPTLPASELAIGRSNTFFIPIDMLPQLEARLFTQQVSFRVLGPTGDADNLFAWDSGFGTRTLGRGPVLRIVTGGPAPLTPPPSPTPNVVVITLTPKDAEGILAAAVVALTATAEAPPELRDATPAPTATPTPLPPNWVTPIVIVNTPLPENSATAIWQKEVATADAVINGTATATPPNVWTATPTHTPLPPPPPTPTPLIVYQNSLTPTATPTITPVALPSLLRGKILFYSDRNGGTQLMVMDPNGSNVAVWTGGDPEWIYETAKRNMDLSPDGRFRVIVSKEQIHTSQLWVVDLTTGRRRQLTYFRDISYDPVWSPVRDQIVFVSPATGNDELYTINADGEGLTQLTFNDWEWDKYPSWSPDGNQVVFWSNRQTRRKQIWIMNADGSNVRNLSNNEYNDWEPVWVK